MKPHVLIVEDEVTLAKNIDQFLARQGFATTIASTISDALCEARNHTIDVILLDIELPDGNGLDAYPKLFKLAPQLRGIVMTGHPRPEYRERVLHLGLNGFLVKPFPLSLLAEQIQTLIGSERKYDPVTTREAASPMASLLAGPLYAWT